MDLRFGTCYSHIEKAGRLFRLLVSLVIAAGVYAILHSHHDDRLEFQPVRTVQCHQIDLARILALIPLTLTALPREASLLGSMESAPIDSGLDFVHELSSYRNDVHSISYNPAQRGNDAEQKMG